MKLSRFQLWVTSFVTVLALSGCGSSSGSFSAGSGAPGGQNERDLDGMVFLGQAIPGITVEARDLSGVALGQATTDEAGCFRFERLPDSDRLVLVASLPDSDYELSTQVGRAGDEDFPVIGIPSTLVARYLQAHPGATWEAAEEWLNGVVGAPIEQDWESFLDESEDMAFSHLGFFSYAAEQGGVAPTVEALLSGGLQAQEVNALADPLFDLEYEDFQANLDRLEPPFARLAKAVLATEKPSFSFSSTAKSILRFVGDGVAANVLDSVINSAWTWLTSSMASNSGPDLESIQGKLNALSSQLDELSRNVDSSQYQQIATDLNSNAVTPLLLLNRRISALALTVPLTNKPFTPSSEVQGLLTELASFRASEALLRIQSAMLGTNGQTNILALTLSAKMNSLGVDQQPQFMNMPVRSNAILNDVLRTYNLYEGYQVLACDILAELSHSPTNPVIGTNIAAQEVALAAASLKMQRSQLPQPLPSDRVLVDLENGLMWYTEIAPARTFASAAAFATNFKLDGSNGVKYSDWRLPTQNELQSLQARGRFCGVRVPNVPVNSEDTTWGQTVSGLAGLGFQEAQRLEPYADVWCRDKWPIYRSGRLHQTYQYVYRLNRKPPEAGLTNLALRSQDKHPFVMVRSIGTNLHPPLHPEVNPALAEPSAIQPGEVYALGVPVEVNTLLQSYEEVGGVLRYAIVVGGAFTTAREGSVSGSIWPPIGKILPPTTFLILPTRLSRVVFSGFSTCQEEKVRCYGRPPIRPARRSM